MSLARIYSMKLIIATECLRTGGAQVFALRLAKALADQGYEIYFFIQYKDYINTRLVEKIYPEVKILYPIVPPLIDFFLRKLDRLFYKLHLDVSLSHYITIASIRYYISKYRIDLVHSNMFQSDYLFAKALKNNSIPLVVTMHGSYESFLEKDTQKENEGYLNYRKKLKQTLQRINSIAYLTDKNLKVFNFPALLNKEDYQHIHFEKIYNGFQGNFENPLNKEDRGIPYYHFVFGMVARGIPEKGWEIAIKAFIELNHPQTSMVLVGHSEYVKKLEEKYSNVPNLIFSGESDNPLDVIHAFDVGLLPSYYGESLPNVIVEYLFCGKAVITTNVGESGRMITNDEGEVAGVIIEESEPDLIKRELIKAMKNYLKADQDLYSRKSVIQSCFDKFQMQYCLNKYLGLYNKAISGSAK